MYSETVTMIEVLLAIFTVTTIGATTQSLSGMGFGMIAAPVLVLLFGPTEGILWGNMLGIVNAAMLLALKRKDTDWAIATRFTVAAIPTIAITVAITHYIPLAPLEVIIGLLIVTMVVFSIAAPRLRSVSGPGPQYLTGAVGGFLSAAVAQAGPAMVAYAQASRWEQKRFAATLQAYFLAMNLFTVPLKWYSGLVADPQSISVYTLGAAIGGLIAGTALSKPLQKHLQPSTLRTFALVVASVGAVTVLVRGFANL
ncbi:MAG: sulfite exporter TauE/SafE family protein [Actinomycetaceae bacterium]|nr:sulfite exporter TauE/SafE family protein [Actinomycetaceae bacterium]